MKFGWFISLILIQCSSIVSTAQKPASQFYFRAGGNLFASWEQDDETFFVPAINVTPGIRLLQSKDFAFTLTAPVSVGPFIRSGSSVTYGADLPAMIELNVLSAAANADKYNLGLMLGAGFAFHVLGRYKDDDHVAGTENTWKSADFWGFRLNAGISFGKNKYGDRGIVIGGFGKSMSSDNRHIVSLGLAFILGNLQKLQELTAPP